MIGQRPFTVAARGAVNKFWPAAFPALVPDRMHESLLRSPRVDGGVDSHRRRTIDSRLSIERRLFWVPFAAVVASFPRHLIG